MAAVNWDDLRFVLALGRAGSLGAAARALKVEASTVSRRLAALESGLGVQLVTRTPEGVVLTEAGQRAIELAETIDVGVDALVRKIGGDDTKAEGVVRLATTDTLATFLMSGLVPLRQAHPKIQIELVVGNSAHDLVRREADLALRLFRETNPNLVSRKLGEIGWSIYASRTYVDRTGVVLGDDLDGCALAGQQVVGFSDSIAKSAAAQWLVAHSRAEDVVLSGSSVMSVMNAVRAGLGVSVLPCFAVHGDATLVRLTRAVTTRVEAFLVLPPEHREIARIRIVMDAVAALFERERGLLTGEQAL